MAGQHTGADYGSELHAAGDQTSPPRGAAARNVILRAGGDQPSPPRERANDDKKVNVQDPIIGEEGRTKNALPPPRERTPAIAADHEQFQQTRADNGNNLRPIPPRERTSPEDCEQFHQYCLRREEKFIVHDYFQDQPHVNKTKRASQINWLITHKDAFKLNTDLIFQAVKLFDCAISNHGARVVEKSQRNALLMASGVVAAKADNIDSGYEYVRKLEMVNVTDVQQMETQLMRLCKFNTRIPTACAFLNRFLYVKGTKRIAFIFARYILELALLYGEFVSVLESVKADAAMALSMQILHMDWESYVRTNSGYSIEYLEPIMGALNHVLRRRQLDSALNLRATEKRHTLSRHGLDEVTRFVGLPSIIPLHAPVVIPAQYKH